MADFGTISLMAALAVCVYGTVIPHFGVKSNNWNLVRSAQNASIPVSYTHLTLPTSDLV